MISIVEKYAENKEFTIVYNHDITKPTSKSQYQDVCKYYHLHEGTLPLIRCCNRTYYGTVNEKAIVAMLDQSRRIDIFKIKNCPACHLVESLEKKLRSDYPAMDISVLELSHADNKSYFVSLIEKSGVDPTEINLPAVFACGRLYDASRGVETTRDAIKKSANKFMK